VRSALPLEHAESKAPLLQPSLAEIRDLADAREAVEGATAALAAQRSSSLELDELQGLVDTMANTTDYGDFRLLDSRFHITLAVAGGSHRLTGFATGIQAELREHIASWPDPHQALGITNGQHRAILAAVASGDAELARSRMVAHVRFTSEYIIQAASAVATVHAHDPGGMPAKEPAEGPATGD
jgi:DNA-binding GntR family transcriptional regulator